MDAYTKNLTTLRDALIAFAVLTKPVNPDALERMRYSAALADCDGILRYPKLYAVAARGHELEVQRSVLRLVEHVRTELYLLFPQNETLRTLFAPTPTEGETP